MDAATRRNLEIDINMTGGDSNTLFSVMDKRRHCHGQPPAATLAAPALDRYPRATGPPAAIRALCSNYYYETVREALKPIGDMERILTRVALRSARPRDLTRLHSSLDALPQLRSELASLRLGIA